MTLVGKILGVDGDNGSRHPTRLGIPAYMIANLKRSCHLAIPLTFKRFAWLELWNVDLLSRVTN
jgi:hypothetical protein